MPDDAGVAASRGSWTVDWLRGTGRTGRHKHSPAQGACLAEAAKRSIDPERIRLSPARTHDYRGREKRVSIRNRAGKPCGNGEFVTIGNAVSLGKDVRTIQIFRHRTTPAHTVLSTRSVDRLRHRRAETGIARLALLKSGDIQCCFRRFTARAEPAAGRTGDRRGDGTTAAIRTFGVSRVVRTFRRIARRAAIGREDDRREREDLP